jgi:tetratricopeptide (TPR) repeat protein
MKKTVLFVFISAAIIASACLAHAAEEPTFTELIQAETAIITKTTELIKKDKDDCGAYYMRGDAHFRLGQIYIALYGAKRNEMIKEEFEAAVADFSAAVTIKPDLLQAFIMRGMAYGQLKLTAAAVADFTHVIQADPKNGYAYYARGREYWANGDYLKAKEDYDKAVELDPQWKDNFYR